MQTVDVYTVHVGLFDCSNTALHRSAVMIVSSVVGTREKGRSRVSRGPLPLMHGHQLSSGGA